MWRPAVLAAVLLASACGPLAPEERRASEPTELNLGMLMVRARVRGAVLPFTSDDADSAVVEQVDADGFPVPGKIAVSGFSRDGGVYFLDLPRGRYALRSISFHARGARYEVDLSSDVLRRDSVELKPGSVAFLGTLFLDGRFPDLDVAALRALGLVGRWVTPFLRWSPIERDADLRGVDKTPTAEKAALFAAREDLKGSQWRQAVVDRLRELQAPEPPATTGGLRDRELPLKQEAFFGWRDTLKWGEPARAPMGLTWRRPDGEARVAVFFTSATAKGFAGYDEAVRQMRAAAGGLEDSASLAEVRVGTRRGPSARQTTYHYPEQSLVGSEVAVIVTETTLIPDPAGMFTARLRAPKDEFEKVLPEYRAFLLQLSLGPAAPVSGLGGP